VFIWMHAEPDRLSRRARDLLVDPDSELHLSVVVARELGIRGARERLTLPEPLDEYVMSRANRLRMSLLPIGRVDVLDAVACRRITQSAENACSNRHEVGVTQDRTGRAPAPVIYSLTAYGESALPMLELVRLWGKGHIERTRGPRSEGARGGLSCLRAGEAGDTVTR
jgi:hypothetical protein